MSRERELRRRREDPHRVPVAVALGHERRLREPDLLRERLHRRVVQVDGLRDDAELVPGERSRREHVDEPEGDVHAAHCTGCTARPRAARREVATVGHGRTDLPRRGSSRGAARGGRGRVRRLVRRDRAGGRVRVARADRDVGDDVRGFGAVRLGLGAPRRRDDRRGGDRGAAPERAVRADRDLGGAVPDRIPVVEARARAARRGRVLGDRRRGRGPVLPQHAARRRGRPVRLVGRRHRDRRARRLGDRRPGHVRARRGVRGVVPRACSSRSRATGGTSPPPCSAPRSRWRSRRSRRPGSRSSRPAPPASSG